MLRNNELSVLLAVAAKRGINVSAPRLAGVLNLSRFAVDRALHKLTTARLVEHSTVSGRSYFAITDAGVQALADLKSDIERSNNG